MSIDITIRQRAADKKPLPLEVIVGEELVYGAFDGLRTNPGEAGEREIVVWNPDHIGRGFSVEWKEGETRKTAMRLPMPSTDAEIKDFYQAVERIAKYWSADIEEDGKRAPIGVFMAGLEGVQELNRRMIVETAEQVFLGEKGACVTVPAALWQLAIGKAEARRFLDRPEEFAEWLHDRQMVDAYYAVPQYFGRGEKVVGRFVLPAEVPAILPHTPGVPFGFVDTDTGLPLVCDLYEIAFYDPAAEKLFACMDYETFLDKVNPEKCSRYDGDCMLIEGLTAEELRQVAGIE